MRSFLLVQCIVHGYIHQLGVSLNHASAITFNTPPQDLRKSQYVAAITPVKGIPFYGYHVGYSYFLKIYLFNPDFESRIVELMRSGAVMRTVFQPFEAHVPFRLQFFIDYNLYGMGWLELEDALLRNNVPGIVSNHTSRFCFDAWTKTYADSTNDHVTYLHVFLSCC